MIHVDVIDEVPGQHVGKSPQPGGSVVETDTPEEETKEQAGQEQTGNQQEIPPEASSEKKERPLKRRKHAGLKAGGQRNTGRLIRIPERNVTVFEELPVYSRSHGLKAQTEAPASLQNGGPLLPASTYVTPGTNG